MLQDISPYKLDNHYDPDIRPDDDSFIIIMRGDARDREVLIKRQEDGTISFPRYSDLLCAGKTNSESIIGAGHDLSAENPIVYIFSISDEKFFLWTDREASELPAGIQAGFTFCKMADVRREGTGPRHYIFAMYTAFHLYEWYSSTRFCGKCGRPNKNDTVERARVCTCCGHKVYPRINPAVIIGVTDKDTGRMILTKYRTGFAQNALVAGFTEIGETLEETVSREVMEEVGLHVENVRYYKSQPWGVACDILSGFFCDVCGDKEIKMDASELKYAQWVAPEDIVLQNPDYSLTNEMMRLFKEKGYEGTV
ncbi:MAG: NUDIX domain-containing protein [Butyrivibrio sp.]|nr:NUDIX domain-containing protein [Butyrivibrio sp.]